MKKFLLGLFALTLGAFAINPIFAKDLTEADVERIIETYIKNNGQIIAESLENHFTAEQLGKARASINDNTPTIGPDDAAVVLIEYSDFRCGYCKRAQDTLTTLRDRYDGRVRFAFKNMPILSEVSQKAAFAATAAHKQGKFWDYTAQLWERQEFLGEKLFKEVAEELNLDMAKFNADRESAAVAALVRQDVEDGRDAGVQGTPFFMVNGTPLSGAQPLDKFVDAIEAELAKADM